MRESILTLKVHNFSIIYAATQNTVCRYALLELMDVVNIISIMCLLDHRVSQMKSGAFK